MRFVPAESVPLRAHTRRFADESSSQRETERIRAALVSFDFGDICVPLANALASYADVCLVLPQAERERCDSPLEGSIRFLPFVKPRLRQVFRQLRLISWMMREVRHFAPDVVHLQQGHLWLNLFVSLLRRYPLVVTVHDPTRHPGDGASAKIPQMVMNLSIRAADQLFVHGEALVDKLVRASGVDQERVHVIPLIKDARVADGVAGIPEETCTVLFFGRIWPYKGLEHLIRAEPLISERVPNLRIVIAGEGEPFDRYSALMRNPERFEVHNEFVSDELRAHLFARASVVVLPYIEASQSGVVPLAQAFAKPVVATTVGALPEAVEDGQTGILVPPADVEALADALVRLLQDHDLRRRLGANGRRRFETVLAAETVAERTLEVYRLAMART